MLPTQKLNHKYSVSINLLHWLLFLLLVASTSYAATIYIDATNQGPEDGSEAKPFNTIQEGIDAAESGDTVQVAAGIYEGAIRFKDGITLQGAGAETTKITITADDGHTIITVTNAKSPFGQTHRCTQPSRESGSAPKVNR